MDQVVDISYWKERLAGFAKDRDWDQFHNPKNLVMALSVESSELVEVFQWLSAEQSKNLSDLQKESAKQEIADVLLYLIRLSDKLDINLPQALEEKFKLNGEKYPVDLARGTEKKYSELKSE